MRGLFYPFRNGFGRERGHLLSVRLADQRLGREKCGIQQRADRVDPLAPLMAAGFLRRRAAVGRLPWTQ